MNHFAKIAAQLESRDLDGMLLTHEANRFYASGFHSAGTDGMALVTREKFYYFTDSRYTEAARRHVQDAEVQEAGHGRGYSALLMEAVQRHSIQRLGFEDAYMTVREHDAYARALPCELVPAADLLAELRAVKDPEELEIMIAAQRIAEKALTDILNEIRPGVTEKEIAARLQYLMLHYGAEDKSFDPIVVSGPNGSLPHGVPSEKVIQAGEFVTMDFGCIYHGWYRSRPGRGHWKGRGRRRPGHHPAGGLRSLFRPQLRPQRGSGDPRGAQRHSLQRQAPARRGGDLCRAGHLPAREAGCAD